MRTEATRRSREGLPAEDRLGPGQRGGHVTTLQGLSSRASAGPFGAGKHEANSNLQDQHDPSRAKLSQVDEGYRAQPRLQLGDMIRLP